MVKSGTLPMPTIASASPSTSTKAPSAGSRRPRGLSRQTTGAPVAARSAAARPAPRPSFSIGPVRIRGRAAPASASATAPASSKGRAAGAKSVGISPSSASAFSTSTGSATCTGPRRPDSASRIASPSIAPSSAGEVGRNVAFTTGAAIAPWSSSWNGAFASSRTGESPLRNRTGLSFIRAE